MVVDAEIFQGRKACDISPPELTGDMDGWIRVRTLGRKREAESQRQHQPYGVSWDNLAEEVPPLKIPTKL